MKILRFKPSRKTIMIHASGLITFRIISAENIGSLSTENTIQNGYESLSAVMKSRLQHAPRSCNIQYPT
jgi:hypothetical protein